MSLFFLFVQFEFTHAVGPHAGRYVVEPSVLRPAPSSPAADGQPAGDEGADDKADGARRGPAEADRLDLRNQQLAGVRRGVGGSDVLVVGVVGAPAARARLLRRAREAEPGAQPAEVPLALVTYVRGTEPLQSAREATARLEAARFAEEHQRQWVQDGLQVLNLAIRGYRAGAPDPYALEVTRRDARRTRIGYGTTEDVQNGAWREAFELPPEAQPRATRIERLRPSEAVATILTGRGEVLEGEDLLMRALIDLDQGRTRAAACQVAAAMRLLPSELGSRDDTDGLDSDSLATSARDAEALASVVVQRPLNGPEVQRLEGIVDSVAGLLDGWRYRQSE